MSLLWSESCNQDTVRAAWTSFNGAFNESICDNFRFYDLAAYSTPVTVSLDVFNKLEPENTCKLDTVSTEEQERIYQLAVSGQLEPQQPLIVGQFGGRSVILTGTVLYHVALRLGADIRYLLINFDDFPMCGGCWTM